MSAIAVRDAPEAGTSASGSAYRVSLDAAPAALLIAAALPWPATSSTLAQGSMAMWAAIAPFAEHLIFKGPIEQIDHMHAESTAEAVMEIRRRSGLTWEELSELFEVSRRSIHHRANGKPVSAKHDRMIRRMLAAVRHLDRGERERARAVLLTVDEGTDVSRFDLLRSGRFCEAAGSISGVTELECRRIPLASTVWDVRRPPSPALLLKAEQTRPRIPAKARAVRPKRTPKRSG